MTTVDNNDAINNARALEKSIADVPKTYEFAYFQPTPSYMSTVDLNTCYSNDSNGGMKKIGEVLGTGNLLHTRDTCKFNAGMIQNRKKKEDHEKLKNIIENTGLTYKIVNGYFNDNPKFFLNATVTSTNESNDFKSISSATNNVLIASDIPNTITLSSVEWYGCFKPTVTGNWTISITSADSCLIWVGTNAENDYTKTNAFINNSGLHDAKYTEKSSHFKKNAHYPIRIQYGHHIGNYNFQLTIKDPKGVDVTNTSLYNLKNKDGSGYMPSLTYYSLIERDNNYTQAGLFDCYVSDNVSKMTPGSLNGCSGTSKDTNGNFTYTTANDWTTGQKFYTYRIDTDNYLDNLYLANKNDKTFMTVKKEDSTTLSNDFIDYDNVYPDPVDIKNANKVNDIKSAQKLCTDDPSCKYFYFYKDNNNNSYCVKKSDSYIPKQFIPKQMNENIKSSKLYIRNLSMKLSDNVHSKIPRKNVLDYAAYTNYEILPAQYDANDKYSGLSSDLVEQLKKNSIYYEGFDNHGYNTADDVTKKIDPNNPSNYKNLIKDNQIKPLQDIDTDYTNNINNIKSNYDAISTKIGVVNNLRGTLSNDPNNKYEYNADTLPYYNGVGGCVTTDSTGRSVIGPCGDKKPTMQDGLNEDVKTIILQQNSIYILGSITAASLLILAIYLGK